MPLIIFWFLGGFLISLAAMILWMVIAKVYFEGFPAALLVVAIVCFLISLCLFGHWRVRSIKCDFLNEKFGTSYTPNEMFWNGEIIQDMIEGEKLRVEME